MTRFASLRALVVCLCLLGAARPALAQPAHPIDTKADLEALRNEPRFTFCKEPKRPMLRRDLCSLAEGLHDCEGFAKACGEPTTKKDEQPGAFMAFLAQVARGLIWVLVAAVIVAIALPLVRALLRMRRSKRLAATDEPAAGVARAQPVDRKAPEPSEIDDAEAALREADELARRGELPRALGLYLAASLSALERRGAIRVARHRTNGEYVRSCAEATSRQPLREIVRVVDRMEFGNVQPTSETVATVAARASAVVRAPAGRGATAGAAALLGVLVMLVVGCGGHGGGPRADDPYGDELPMELLRHSGYSVSYLPTSLTAIPMPARFAAAPLVVVDVTRVTLEDESEAHLLRWVEAGGILVLLGPPQQWPKELGAHVTAVDGSHFNLGSGEFQARDAIAAAPVGLRWEDSRIIGRIGKTVYAAHKDIGRGAVVGIAGHELLTNIGVAVPENAEALVALLHVAARDRFRTDPAGGTFEVQVARVQDGISPPTNPFSAIQRAGLGKGAWHALVASFVLFLAFGIRQARARPAGAPARRAFAEHVEATGAFYGRARALPHALAAYGRFAELRIRERLPPGGDPLAFLVARAGITHEHAERVWRRAIEAKADDPIRGDELATIRDLRAVLVKAAADF